MTDNTIDLNAWLDTTEKELVAKDCTTAILSTELPSLIHPDSPSEQNTEEFRRRLQASWRLSE